MKDFVIALKASLFGQYYCSAFGLSPSTPDAKRGLFTNYRTDDIQLPWQYRPFQQPRSNQANSLLLLLIFNLDDPGILEYLT